MNRPLLCATIALPLVTCGLEPGPAGPQGPPGPQGPQGAPATKTIIEGSRLQIRYFKGADGSQLPMPGIWDVQRGEVCEFAIAEDDKLRCLPLRANAVGNSGFYVDAGCTVPAFAGSTNPCATPKYGHEAVAGACGPVRFYTLTRYPSSTLYYRDSGMCKSMPAAGNEWYSGKAIPATEFVEGQTTP